VSTRRKLAATVGALMIVGGLVGCSTPAPAPKAAHHRSSATSSAAVATIPTPKPTRTPLVGQYSGSANVVDLNGYSFRLSYTLSFATPIEDVADALPSKVNVVVPFNVTMRITNTTDGRNFPFVNTAGQFQIRAIYAKDSVICAGIPQDCPSMQIVDMVDNSASTTLGPGQSETGFIAWDQPHSASGQSEIVFQNLPQADWPAVSQNLVSPVGGLFVTGASMGSYSSTASNCLQGNGTQILIPSTVDLDCNDYI
jgi:hypothetical protein